MQALVAVAVIGAIGGVGLKTFGGLFEVSQESRLESEVASLNAAVGVYVASGGLIPAGADVAEVVGLLKTTMSDDDRDRQAEFGGSLIDPRLTPVVEEAVAIPAGERRVVWVAAQGRFAITTGAVAGATSFELAEGAEAARAVEGAQRASHFLYAAESGWVWDYQDQTPTGVTRTGGIVGPGILGGGGGAGVLSPSALPLSPPVFSLGGGIYAEEDFDLELRFSNTNPIGVSDIWYSVDGAPYQLYVGNPVLITGEAEVAAFARSIDPDSWVDSEAVIEGYRQDILYFAGNTSGRFLDPVGDVGMVVSIENSDTAAEMWWGSPYIRGGWFEGNYLRFEGEEFADVRAFEEFEIGTLTYFNSTTYAGTNATGVDLELMLQILVPDVTAAFTYGFELLSTPNSSGNTADENADYVWIGDVDGSFSAEIRGYDYTLELRFAELTEDADGFTTPDTFHVHEGSWATGTVYGTLIRGERSAGNDGDPTPVGPLPEEDPEPDPAA